MRRLMSRMPLPFAARMVDPAPMRWPVVLLSVWPGLVVAESLPASYVLVRMAGAAKAPRATLVFEDNGRVGGLAPCNRWFAQVDGTPPAFAVGPVATTRMACPDMAAEVAFLDLLSRATAVERLAEQVTLFDVNGAVLLVFDVAAG
jgi:heat shock protein HslJ